jgi:hypothetical protein
MTPVVPPVYRTRIYPQPCRCQGSTGTPWEQRTQEQTWPSKSGQARAEWVARTEADDAASNDRVGTKECDSMQLTPWAISYEVPVLPPS